MRTRVSSILSVLLRWWAKNWRQSNYIPLFSRWPKEYYGSKYLFTACSFHMIFLEVELVIQTEKHRFYFCFPLCHSARNCVSIHSLVRGTQRQRYGVRVSSASECIQIGRRRKQHTRSTEEKESVVQYEMYIWVDSVSTKTVNWEYITVGKYTFGIWISARLFLSLDPINWTE